MSEHDERASRDPRDFPDHLCDWVGWVDETGYRYFVRPSGYKGAPTAELRPMSFAWVATSWIVQPPRTMVLPRPLSLRETVSALKLAEDEGQASTAWLPLDAPGKVSNGGWPGCIPGTMRCHEFHITVWSTIYIIFEVLGEGGVASFAVALNGDLVTDGGSTRLFETAELAREFVEWESM